MFGRSGVAAGVMLACEGPWVTATAGIKRPMQLWSRSPGGWPAATGGRWDTGTRAAGTEFQLPSLR